MTRRGHVLSADHYRVLQVTREADPEVIERAYKALSRKYHPDMNPADKAHGTRQMQKVNEAYGVLRDPRKRAAYDATLLPENAHGWDIFLERGLVGLFVDRLSRRS